MILCLWVLFWSAFSKAQNNQFQFSHLDINNGLSQICHKVGFKSQKYFVKSFKAEYNTIPSRYVESMGEEEVAG